MILPLLSAALPAFRSSPAKRRLSPVRMAPASMVMSVSLMAGHVLLRDHGVAAGRHHAAGHDAHAFAGAGTSVGRPAGVDGGDDFQRGRAVGAQVGAAQRVAVHRRIVVRRHVDRRDDVGRQHAVQRGAQRDFFDRADRRDEVADDVLRVAHRQRVGVVVGQAAERRRAGAARAWCRGCAVRRAC